MDEFSISVLELLLFPEHFNNIVDECRMNTTRHIVGDILKNLLHDGLVSPLILNDNGGFVRSIGYDSDNMEAFYYQITAKGIDALSAHNQEN
ncbi:MAG: hypothetical protein KC517_07260 [Bacteroidetes bacterium]|jgi:hypothetical protein|nr:hypothetical protein [Bacteroidota bacterium]